MLEFGKYNAPNNWTIRRAWRECFTFWSVLRLYCLWNYNVSVFIFFYLDSKTFLSWIGKKYLFWTSPLLTTWVVLKMLQLTFLGCFRSSLWSRKQNIFRFDISSYPFTVCLGDRLNNCYSFNQPGMACIFSFLYRFTFS